MKHSCLLDRFTSISQLGFFRNCIVLSLSCKMAPIIIIIFGVNFMSIISQYPDGWWLCLGRLQLLPSLVASHWDWGFSCSERGWCVTQVTSSHLLAVFWSHDSGLRSYHCSTVVFTVVMFYISRLTSILLNFESNPCFCGLFLS